MVNEWPLVNFPTEGVVGPHLRPELTKCLGGKGAEEARNSKRDPSGEFQVQIHK